MRPEFLNRIDEVITFQPLKQEEIRQVVQLQLNNIQRMLTQNGVTLEVMSEAIDFLARVGYDPDFGARPVKRVIQKEILNELSREILEEKIKTNDTIIIDVIDGQFVFYNPVAGR